MMPNIIIIVVDALRTRNLSLYGYKRETDKNMKKIASESVFFSNNFSTSNTSYPSLTSIFSGLYQTNHGIMHQYPYMEKEELEKLKKIKFWLPTYLQSKGYNTLSITPQVMWFKKGFDYIGEEPKTRYEKFKENKIIKKILLKLPNFLYSFAKKIMKQESGSGFAPPDEAMNFAISKIKNISKKPEPFFAFMHFEYTHFPYPTIKVPKVRGTTTLNDILRKVKTKSQQEYIKKRFYDIKLKYLEEIKAKYDSAVIEIDIQIGRLYNFLKQEKLFDNSIFIILADHGECLDEHGIYLGRGGVYDEMIHVPLIMRFPEIKGEKIDELTQSIDIAPTILDFLGEKEQKIDGKSLLELIKRGKPVRSEIFAYDGICKDRQAIRTKTKKKIITAEDGKCYICGAKHGRGIEEYDLKKDPLELKNISKDISNE